jgi:alpha-tubulin suppressor-like RCC1 family protein
MFGCFGRFFFSSKILPTRSLAKNIRSKVFAYGWNWDGQLGLGDKADRLVPTPLKSFALLKLLHSKSVLQVVAGGEHSVALDNSGAVYTWGGGKLGMYIFDFGGCNCLFCYCLSKTWLGSIVDIDYSNSYYYIFKNQS